MKKNAVLLTVLFAFIVTSISISIVFWEFLKLSEQRYFESIFAKHSTITQIYQQHIQEQRPNIMLEANLAIYNINLEKDRQKVKSILKNARSLMQKDFQSIGSSLMVSSMGTYTKKVVQDMSVSMLEHKKNIYFYIKAPSSSILVHDEELKPFKSSPIIYIYSVIISVILLSFLLILQKLRPLIRLRKKIALYGKGNMNISFSSSGEDEISMISNEMEAAKNKINDILESRTLFLRNIMHELKTPIAKGTIATQMLESQKQRDRFVSIFGRLESLVNEFALIEEVTSVGDKSEFKEYRVIDLVDGAIDMAMIDRDSLTIDVEASIKVSTSYRLYTTAIKNMLDNGIKYSQDAKVKILYKNGELCFENRGDRLAKPLSYYIEPFTKENPAKNSFGLGLYLVDSILKVHDEVLAYEYEDGINRFVFAKNKKIL
ncbi:MAG: ArsS family sensor histidine kinase [Sulfurimonas sp.]|jgi:two-component system OmpR family sensor kinase|nr:ArsS family sensor histidine kinase [Sulfurimonadaceae bacterium]